MAIVLLSLQMNTAGTQIIGRLSAQPDPASVPAPGDFPLFGAIGVISSVALGSNYFALTLSVLIGRDELIGLSYVPGAFPIKDLGGSPLAGFTRQNVNTATSDAAPVQIARTGATQLVTMTGRTSGHVQTGTLVLPSDYNDPGAPALYPWVKWRFGRLGTVASMLGSFVAQLQTAEAAGICMKHVHILPDYGTTSWWVDALDNSNPAGTMGIELEDFARSHLRLHPSWGSEGGFSMGTFGDLCEGLLNPGRYRNLIAVAGANCDTLVNNWATPPDSTDKTVVFSDDNTYLQSKTASFIAGNNIAAILASGVRIRTALWSADPAVAASFTAFRAAAVAAGVPIAQDEIAASAHSAANYATADGSAVAKWLQASYCNPASHGAGWLRLVR